MRPIITLTTDFGERDPHVAMIKGTLYSRCNDAKVVDLSHSLPRANIIEASLFVTGAVRHFPKGTIHLVSVAGAASPMAVRVADQYVLCPNNGLATVLDFTESIEGVREITNLEIVNEKPGQIYLARDILSPAASHLANSGDFSVLGAEMSEFVHIDMKLPKVGEKEIRGEIILIDNFGNLITNIDRSVIGDATISSVEVTGFPVGPVRSSFSEVEVGNPIALMNSGGMLQISYNGDRADSRLGAQIGNKVVVAIR